MEILKDVPEELEPTNAVNGNPNLSSLLSTNSTATICSSTLPIQNNSSLATSTPQIQLQTNQRSGTPTSLPDLLAPGNCATPPNVSISNVLRSIGPGAAAQGQRAMMNGPMQHGMMPQRPANMVHTMQQGQNQLGNQRAMMNGPNMSTQQQPQQQIGMMPQRPVHTMQQQPMMQSRLTTPQQPPRMPPGNTGGQMIGLSQHMQPTHSTVRILLLF